MYINCVKIICRTFAKCGYNLVTLALVRGEVVSLQVWSDPEGSRKLRFPDFMTTAKDGGKVVSPTHRPHLPQESAPGTHIC